MNDLSELQQQAFGDIAVSPRACPLCAEWNESTPAGPYSLGNWTVKDCRHCGFTYITSAPDSALLFEDMSWDRTAQVRGEWRQSTQRVQHRLSRLTRWRMRLLPRKKLPQLVAQHARPGNVLDLGCAAGNQLNGLPEEYVPHGIEIASEPCARADESFRARGGYAVNAPCLEGLRQLPDGNFSAATLRSYLEHESEPAAVLNELHRVLAPGGVAVVKVPNYGSLNRRLQGLRWCGFRHPDHLNYFTPDTLSRMAAVQGFDTWFGATWKLPTSDNMWALLRR